jgi:hypothetical protein
MTEATVEEQLADHGARIGLLEKSQSKIEGRLDALVLFMMGTFATSAAGLLSILLTNHK